MPQLKHLVGHGDKIRQVHGEQDFREHTFRLGQQTPRGTEILAEPKARLKKKGKKYSLFGYLTSG